MKDIFTQVEPSHFKKFDLLPTANSVTFSTSGFLFFYQKTSKHRCLADSGKNKNRYDYRKREVLKSFRIIHLVRTQNFLKN